MEFYIEKMKSEKSNKEYIVLVADLGYVKQVISYDTSIMILLANKAPQDFYSALKNVGDKIVLVANKVK